MKYIIDPYPQELKALNTKAGFYKEFTKQYKERHRVSTPREVFEELNEYVFEYFGRVNTTTYRSFSIQYKAWKLKQKSI